jgi:hypothetical protein
MAQYASIETTYSVKNIVDSTSFAWTAGLAAGATTGTLSSTWAFATGVYLLRFTDLTSVGDYSADQRTVTLTNGSATVTWTQPLVSSAGTAVSVDTINSSNTVTPSNAPVLCTSSNTTSGVVLAAKEDRIGWSIQNQGTNVVQVCFGTGASTTQLHYTLKGCTGTADGTGGSISFFTGAVYKGVVSVAGTSFSVSVVDLTK